MPDEQTPEVVYLGQRLDELRQTISTSSASLHQRLDALPEDIERGMQTAVETVMVKVEPLIPRPPKLWERPPYNWMVMAAFMWCMLVGTGVVMTVGLLPERLLEQIGTVVSAYFSSVGTESAALSIAGDLLASPAAAADTVGTP